MGNQKPKGFGLQLEEFDDPNNIQVVIEKDTSSSISNQAEGTYIIPSTTNCVKIADLIFSLIRTPIVLYLCGQEYTHNYTPLNMLTGLMDDGCLHLIYTEKPELGKDTVMIDEYIQPVEMRFQDPLRFVFRPKQPKTGQVFKIQPWDGFTIRQLCLILTRISGTQGIVILYKNEPISGDRTVKEMREYIQVDGLIHLKYTY